MWISGGGKSSDYLIGNNNSNQCRKRQKSRFVGVVFLKLNEALTIKKKVVENPIVIEEKLPKELTEYLELFHLS